MLRHGEVAGRDGIAVSGAQLCGTLPHKPDAVLEAAHALASAAAATGAATRCSAEGGLGTRQEMQMVGRRWLRGFRVGVEAGSKAELMLAKELAKDKWGRWGGREGKMARIAQAEAAAAAEAAARTGEPQRQLRAVMAEPEPESDSDGERRRAKEARRSKRAAAAASRKAETAVEAVSGGAGLGAAQEDEPRIRSKKAKKAAQKAAADAAADGAEAEAPPKRGRANGAQAPAPAAAVRAEPPVKAPWWAALFRTGGALGSISVRALDACLCTLSLESASSTRADSSSPSAPVRNSRTDPARSFLHRWACFTLLPGSAYAAVRRSLLQSLAQLVCGAARADPGGAAATQRERERKRGFDEADQEDLFTKAHDAKKSGHKGLGAGSGANPPKVAGARWKGIKARLPRSPRCLCT